MEPEEGLIRIVIGSEEPSNYNFVNGTSPENWTSHFQSDQNNGEYFRYISSTKAPEFMEGTWYSSDSFSI